MNEDLSFGTRGGTLVRHFFPLDGEYVLKIRLARDYRSSSIRAIETREQIDVRLDGARVKLFEIGGECVGVGRSKVFQEQYRLRDAAVRAHGG